MTVGGYKRASFGKKKVKKTNGKPATRRRADVVLAQGTGGTVTRAFGSRGSRVPRSLGNGGGMQHDRVWNAFDPSHAPLPRCVGPYTVVRTSTLTKTSSRVNVIGTFGKNAKSTWSDVCMISSVDSTLPISDNNNSRTTRLAFPGSNLSVGSTLQAVPSAISVQIMNPNAIGHTSGMVTGAVCPAQLDLSGRAETWNDFASEFISFMRPRIMSAGKLSLRGVTANSYPLNMNRVAEFRPIESLPDGTITWGENHGLGPEAWAPMVLIIDQPAGSPPEWLELNLLICIEWRVRFDIGNPAVASHTQHGITSEGTWASMINKAQSLGHGMKDIAEVVASAGSAFSAVRAMGPLMG